MLRMLLSKRSRNTPRNQLYRRDRRTYLTVVKMIGEGLSTRLDRVCCGISPSSVEAIRQREQLSIEVESASVS